MPTGARHATTPDRIRDGLPVARPHPVRTGTGPFLPETAEGWLRLATFAFLAVVLSLAFALFATQSQEPIGPDVVLVPGSPIVVTVEVLREVPAPSATAAPTPPRCATPVEGLVCRWPRPEDTRPQGGGHPRAQ